MIERVTCPKCGGPMWDNRFIKRNPKAPDYKCRDRSCDGVIWPPRASAAPQPVEPYDFGPYKTDDQAVHDMIAAELKDQDELPFR